jgi:hypothetical protein
MLKAALNRAFHTDRVSSDMAWRKVKPFKRVDEAMVRYLSAAEARRLVKAARWRWLSRKPPRAPGNDLKAHLRPSQRPERSRLMPFRNAGRMTLSTTSRGLESVLVLDLRPNLSIAPFKKWPALK